jgi:hypothetical protein
VAWAQLLRVWDALWSSHPSPHFHLYVCVALLQTHRTAILTTTSHLDHLLRLVNDLAGEGEHRGR